MEKIIAILTQKNSLSKGLQDNTTVNLFKLYNEKVMEVVSLKLDNISENYFSLLMAIKKVSLIYAGTISNSLKNMLNKIGIKTKCSEDIVNDRFIDQFIFD
jgi:hypothetical protein